jgi:hypothetical protein
VKVEILSLASQDLIDGYRFYERQAEGIGGYLLVTLYSDIDSLIVAAGIHPIYFDKYHRVLSKRFPFAIYYRVEDKVPSVYAVLDCRRSPAWTRRKLARV